MDIKVQCPGCSEILRVPLDAAGRVALCPSCKSKFQVPEPNDIVEQTVSQWIEEDVDEMQEQEDQEWAHRLQREAEEKERVETERKEETAREIERVMSGGAAVDADEEEMTIDDLPSVDEPDWEGVLKGASSSQTTTAPPPTPVPATAPPAPVPVPSQEEPEQVTVPEPTQPEKPRIPVSSPGQQISVTTQDETVSQYPKLLIITEPMPHLVVTHCTQRGVQLSFASRFIKHTRFRLSMPIKCTYTCNMERKRLLVRPLAFLDRSQAKIRNAHEIEAGHECHLGDIRVDESLLSRLGVIEGLPEPFHLCFPYYVSDDHSGKSLKCNTTKRPDGGITASVLIPDGRYALEWLAAVNGKCGKEYQLLQKDVARLWQDQWGGLPEKVRERLNTWVEFQPDEQFRYYIHDADIARKDEGLAGVVLTNRRLIYHKYHKQGQVVFGEDAKLIVKPDGQFAGLTVRSEEGSVRAARFHFNDLEKLRDAAQELGMELIMSRK